MRSWKSVLALCLILALCICPLAIADTTAAALAERLGISEKQAAEMYPKSITKGSNGDTVKLVQAQLIALGYLNDKADGSFGGKTKAAVELFEKEQNLICDGVLEPLEIYYLLNGGAMTRDEVIISNATSDNPDSVAAALAVLPVRVASAKVLVQSKLNKETYPDMLTAVLENHTKKNIVSYTVGFLAYDADGQPVQIHTQYDTKGYYEVLGDAQGDLAAGKTFGASYGWRLCDDHGIVTLIACVQCVTFEDGRTWENPIYSVWRDCFIENVLPQSMR